MRRHDDGSDVGIPDLIDVPRSSSTHLGERKKSPVGRDVRVVEDGDEACGGGCDDLRKREADGRVSWRVERSKERERERGRDEPG